MLIRLRLMSAKERPCCPAGERGYRVCERCSSDNRGIVRSVNDIDPHKQIIANDAIDN